MSTQDRWGFAALLSAEHRSKLIVMAGGILLFAINVFITAALLPSAVAEIGGREFYGWVMTAFLVPAVASSLLVGPGLQRYGGRRVYQVAFGVFALGSLITAIAPVMPVLLAGRAVQGMAGGLLAGLGYAVIRRALPEELRSRAIGLISAMWGVGNLVGPAVGGLFAEFGLWRVGLVVLLVGAVALGLLARRALPVEAIGSRGGPVAVRALVSLSAAAAAVSVAGVLHGVPAAAVAAAAVLLAAAFVRRERGAAQTVLPALTYRSGNPLKWVYLSIALLAAVSTSEAFIPLFGQELGRLGPLVAGLLGAALSMGWSVAGLAASNLDGPRARATVRVLGPGLLAVGFAAYALLQRPDPEPLIITGWFVALFVGGMGIGMAFQHGATAAMAAAPSEEEATRAATGVSTVQLMANAIGSALAGALVNLGGPEVLGSAHVLLYAFAGLAAVGMLTAWRANVALSAAASTVPAGAGR